MLYAEYDVLSIWKSIFSLRILWQFRCLIEIILSSTLTKESRFTVRICALENSIGIEERFIITRRSSFALLSIAVQSIPKISSANWILCNENRHSMNARAIFLSYLIINAWTYHSSFIKRLPISSYFKVTQRVRRRSFRSISNTLLNLKLCVMLTWRSVCMIANLVPSVSPRCHTSSRSRSAWTCRTCITLMEYTARSATSLRSDTCWSILPACLR